MDDSTPLPVMPIDVAILIEPLRAAGQHFYAQRMGTRVSVYTVNVPRAAWPVLRDAGFVSIDGGSWYWTADGTGEPNPAVGVGVTEPVGSDRYVHTIVRVAPSLARFWMRRDRALRSPGNILYGVQNYIYEPDPNGEESECTLRPSGFYSVKGSTRRVIIGMRSGHFDEGF